MKIGEKTQFTYDKEYFEPVFNTAGRYESYTDHL